MSATQARELAGMFYAVSAGIEEEKDYLSELDGAVGDGDHGITMSIGFRAVNTALSRLELETCSPADVLTTAATAFLNAVGASTGPLYATAFLRAAHAVRERDCIDCRFVSDMLAGMVAGICERGKARRGDKTMLDVWSPAAEAAHNACERGLPMEEMFAEICRAAEKGVLSTRSMMASKGRALRLRERSIGHIDPGAASAAIFIRALGRSLTDVHASAAFG